ncbi:PhoH-like protein [Mannheimia haemolytica]|nr:PhoH-like protein [Mannheimia haemolytica]
MNEIIFSLEPQDNARLQSLCGAFDEHLALIEKSFNLIIARTGFNFTIQSEDDNHYSATLVQNSVKLIKQLYNETAPIKGKIKELDLEDIHLAIQESRMLLQNQWQAGSQGEIAIKTKRGVIKPRGEHQQAYLRNILSHDISFGIGPAGTGKTFLAVAAAVESLERQEIRRILLTRPAVEAGEKLGFFTRRFRAKN